MCPSCGSKRFERRGAGKQDRYVCEGCGLIAVVLFIRQPERIEKGGSDG